MADMYTKLLASRSYTYAVARACDAGYSSNKVIITNCNSYNYFLFFYYIETIL